MLRDNAWLIVGGRRWARILAWELDSILSQTDTIIVNAPICEAEVSLWPSRVKIFDGLQQAAHVALLHSGGQPWAIVANSAYLHATTARELLHLGFNVVSEKPLGLSRLETQSLIDTGRNFGLEVLGSNTLRFSTGLHHLKTRLLNDASVNTVSINWSDARNEFRYGEAKTFDSTTPVIYDVLPHIACILVELFGKRDSVLRQIQVWKGGQNVRIDYGYGAMTLEVNLARQAGKRVRVIQFDGSDIGLELDFSTDPGVVLEHSNGGVVLQDLEATHAGPLGRMLAALNRLRDFGIKDPRLSTDSVIVGSELIDLAAGPYVTHQIAYLESHTQTLQLSSDDLAYAIREVDAISTRAAKFLSADSPLNRLVEFYEAFPQGVERLKHG